MLKDSHYTEKTLNFIDKHIEPNRYAWVFNVITQKLMFALVIPNALLMLVPIVFTNGPPSQCITLMAMTWLLSDGYYYLLMLGISLFVFVAYIILFFVFAKLLYRTTYMDIWIMAIRKPWFPYNPSFRGNYVPPNPLLNNDNPSKLK